MIGVGESTGNLSGTFTYVSESYEEATDETLRQMTALIEPFLMLCIGMFVGLLALAVIAPIYQLTSVINIK